MFKVYNNDTRTTYRRNDATVNDVSDNSLTFFHIHAGICTLKKLFYYFVEFYFKYFSGEQI